MTKFKNLISAALALCFITLSVGCDSVTPENNSSSEVSATIETNSSSENSTENTVKNDSVVPSKATSASTKKTEPTTEPTTEALTEFITEEYNPTQIHDNSYNYSFSLSGFDTVTSLPDFENCLSELQTIINNSNFKLAFCFKNIETGASINFNENSRFMTCSTIKAPFVKSILEQNIDLDQKLSKKFTWSGDSGYVASLPYGKEITAKELIRRTLSYSDNSAYYNLHGYFGYNQFNSNQYKLGTSISLGSSWIFTYCTALDMLKNYEDIYNYIQTGDNGDLLKKYMTAKDVDVNMQIRSALESKYTVCEKYGSQFYDGVDDNQFHACAIVFADSPYVLTVFTNQIPETEKSSKVFKELAVVFDNINTVIYTNNN